MEWGIRMNIFNKVSEGFRYTVFPIIFDNQTRRISIKKHNRKNRNIVGRHSFSTTQEKDGYVYTYGLSEAMIKTREFRMKLILSCGLIFSLACNIILLFLVR